MDKTELILKARNTLHGLAIGDAINWNSVYHRSFAYPYWTRRLRREIDLEQDTKNVIKTCLPFSLNQQPGNFNLSPTDDTEWVVFNMMNLIKKNGNYDFQIILDEWKKLSERKTEIRGSISIVSALHNISKKQYPPFSGRDNPHYFDDSAMVRSIPIVLAHRSDLDAILDNVSKDASITNSMEGIESACLYSELLYHCLNGIHYENYINTISDKIFSSKWIDSLVKRSLDMFLNSQSLFDLIPLLNNRIIDNSYNYGSAAPINLAVIIAIVKYYDDNFVELLLSANSITKAADSITPMIGALAGAKSVGSVLTPQWETAISKVKGICIPWYKDLEYLDLVEKFIEQSVLKSGE